MIVSVTFLKTTTPLRSMECRKIRRRLRIEYQPFFSKGYAIIPVNPSADMILNRRCYHSLKEVDEHIDIIEVFRPSEEALSIVQEAIERKKEQGDIAVIWLQEGIRNEEAKMLAEKNGIIFIQDRCMFKEYNRAFSA